MKMLTALATVFFLLCQFVRDLNMSRPMKPKWTKEALDKALQAVSEGMGKRKAADTFGIPWGTFCDKLSGRRKLDGSTPQTYLTPTEEEEIITFLKESNERAFGRTKSELFVIVRDMLNFRGRQTKWEANLPSEKWFRLFKKRHPELTIRKPQKLGKQRALVTKGSILKWFDDFSECVKKIDPTILLEPERLYNCDESGFSLDATTSKIIAFTGAKFVYQLGSEQKTMITVLTCCSASGHFTWPMLIYPGTQFRGFKPQEVFLESFVTKSKNGWTNGDIFYEWLRSVFIPQTEHVKKPFVLLVDGHVSHQSLQAATLCQEHQIVLYALPPHASHIMQPLDVGVFKTMKGEWRKAVKKHSEIDIVSKRTFALVFKEAYRNTVSRNLAAKAFRHSGLFPLDPSNIDWEKVLPLPVQQTVPQDMTSPGTLTPTCLDSELVTPNANGDGCLSPSSNKTIPEIENETREMLHLPAAVCLEQCLENIQSQPSTSKSTPLSTCNTTAAPSLPVAGGASTNESTHSLYFDPTSSLREFAILCGRIGEATVHLYFTRLEEGFDEEDPIYALWKHYYDVIISPQLQEPEGGQIVPSPKDPLSLPTLQRGGSAKRKRSMEKLPSLISGQEFVDSLINKERMQKEEEDRKLKRKAEMEVRKVERAKMQEEKQKARVAREKQREERKKQIQEEKEYRKKMQQERKLAKEKEMEEKKRQMLEAKEKRSKGKGKKSKKKMKDSNSDTSADFSESEMILFDDDDLQLEDFMEEEIADVGIMYNEPLELDETEREDMHEGDGDGNK